MSTSSIFLVVTYPSTHGLSLGASQIFSFNGRDFRHALFVARKSKVNPGSDLMERICVYRIPESKEQSNEESNKNLAFIIRRNPESFEWREQFQNGFAEPRPPLIKKISNNDAVDAPKCQFLVLTFLDPGDKYQIGGPADSLDQARGLALSADPAWMVEVRNDRGQVVVI